MILLALATGCFPTATATDTSGTDSGDSAEVTHTGETGGGGFVGTFDKYKTDSTASLRSVYSSGAGVYLVGSRGTAWVGNATDGFSGFSLPAEFTGVDVADVWGAGKEDSLQLLIAGDQGLVAAYSASSWQVYPTGARDHRAVAATSLTDVYVVGDNGVQHFDGSMWSTLYTADRALNDVCSFSGGAFVAGDEGLVLQCTSSGCTELDAGRSANFMGISCEADDEMFVVGAQGQAMYYNGSKFTSKSTDVDSTLNAVFMEDGEAVAVGNTGVGLRYDGDEWAPLNVDTEQNLFGVHGVSASNAWAVGDGGVALQYKAD